MKKLRGLRKQKKRVEESGILVEECDKLHDEVKEKEERIRKLTFQQRFKENESKNWNSKSMSQGYLKTRPKMKKSRNAFSE